MYTDLIFDLYGTLVDIHTEEDAPAVWAKAAVFFGFYGAHYTGEALQAAFTKAMNTRRASAGQSYECFPEIPFEQVMAELFREKGVTDADALGVQASQLFRITAMEYIRPYPGVKEALAALRRKGRRLWLLTNAQRVFTAYELQLLGLDEMFDGIYMSSDYGCMKPDVRFYQALIEEQHLDVNNCLMIGNDRETDIAGAKRVGLATMYMHTDLTPKHQTPADTKKRGKHREFEGADWARLVRRL